MYLCAFSAIFGQLAPPEGQGIPPVEGDPRNRVDRWLTTRRKFGKGPFGRFLDEGIKTLLGELLDLVLVPPFWTIPR